MTTPTSTKTSIGLHPYLVNQPAWIMCTVGYNPDLKKYKLGLYNTYSSAITETFTLRFIFK